MPNLLSDLYTKAVPPPKYAREVEDRKKEQREGGVTA